VQSFGHSVLLWVFEERKSFLFKSWFISRVDVEDGSQVV
jgi:hypothetical protein